MKNNNGILLSKSTVLFALFIITFFLTSLTRLKHDDPNSIETLYKRNLHDFKKSIESFKTAVVQKKDIKVLKNEFLRSRIVYKKLAVLTDYFNQYESRLLNAPPISRIESEVADSIIPPKGFQPIEEILYSDFEGEASYPALSDFLNDMLQVINRLEKEPDLTYKFKDEFVWDALRSNLVQMMTLTITGFDSQLALHTFDEANAGIQGINELLGFYKKNIDEKIPGRYEALQRLLNKCAVYLQSAEDFNKFDRLTFITEYMNPLYSLFIQTRIAAGIAVPPGTSPVNYNATSIFGENTFNINFYSPPEDYWVTPERVVLGKKLFADPILSGTKTRSCASCHNPNDAFADKEKTPYSLDSSKRLLRNSPTLWNSGYQTKQFYDSRADILENQLVEVVHNTDEMDGSLKRSVIKLKTSEKYLPLFQKAYPTEKDPVNAFTIANAIATYVRSLKSLNSRFDQYMRGDKSKLNIKEKLGFNLFMGKAKCATCHFLPLFNGVVPPFYAETESEVLGVPKTKSKTNAVVDDDLGKYYTTHSEIHKYAFKTSSIRNIEFTAPYMHNGVYNTLEEVMDFYNKGGGKGLGIHLENQTLPFDKLSLSRKEIKAIISFMNALSDTTTHHSIYNF